MASTIETITSILNEGITTKSVRRAFKALRTDYPGAKRIVKMDGVPQANGTVRDEADANVGDLLRIARRLHRPSIPDPTTPRDPTPRDPTPKRTSCRPTN